jgi:hypothetical protein
MFSLHRGMRNAVRRTAPGKHSSENRFGLAPYRCTLGGTAQNGMQDADGGRPVGLPLMVFEWCVLLLGGWLVGLGWVSGWFRFVRAG